MSGYYREHLQRVSRSFAFCIEKLDEPFRHWVGLSYLLCRVLDTVEDSPWQSLEIQRLQFDQFHAFLDNVPELEALATWASRFSASIPEGETLLLRDSMRLFVDLQQIPATARRAIQLGVKRMDDGMAWYAAERVTDGQFKLLNLRDVNRYCYIVAGLVGELLTKLYCAYRPDFKPTGRFQVDACHFGLFLQKINLLKDQGTDAKEGRFLVPNREVLLSSLRKDAEGALRYLQALPGDEKGFRTFCGWSLFLGAASLPWIQKNAELGDGSKIPREVTQALLAQIEEIVQDNGILDQVFAEYFPELPAVEDQAPLDEKSTAWFGNLTSGALPASELASLGM